MTLEIGRCYRYAAGPDELVFLVVGVARDRYGDAARWLCVSLRSTCWSPAPWDDGRAFDLHPHSTVHEGAVPL